MQGLAHDRGLFVPDSIPTLTHNEMESVFLRGSKSYADVATYVIGKYVKGSDVPSDVLRDIVHRSCAAFRCGEEVVTPLVQVNGHWVLELFHGPTFAFKDVALQMLGNFFEYFLSTGSNDGRLAILGATSGDTGSAAIYGLRSKPGIDCIILYPKGRVSAIQERQMTTVPDDNIHCVSIEGTFDDCQDLVKAAFRDESFREEVKLGAVNSINWCRVLAQMTYYVWSYLRITDDPANQGKEVHFSVPTGNFGDVLAGYYAKRMGVPIGKLIVATNENDILHRFFTRGEYHREDIHATISPSMDICVSSNFERFLFHLAGDDSDTLRNWMTGFEQSGKLTISGEQLLKAQATFLSARADTNQTLATIKQYNEEYQYLLCPHSAVGVSAVEQLDLIASNTVCLATAHEAKFPAAVSRAITELPVPPSQLSEIMHLPTRSSECPNDLSTVQAFMRKRIAERIAGDAATESSKEKKGEASDMQKLITGAVVVGTLGFAVSYMLRRRR